MLVRRISAVMIAALLGGLLLAAPAQALIVDDGGGGGGGGGPIPAAITFDDQHGDASVINTNVGSTVNPPDAAWAEHTFTGWFTAASGGTHVTFPYVVTGNSTLYAHWTLNSYTVTFQPGNGSAATTATANYQTTISAPAQPSRAHYAFAGWFTADSDGTQVDFPYTVTGDVSLYAQWTSTDITLTADAQNGTAPSVVTQPDAFVILLSQPLYAGHTFVGWWTAPTGGTVKPSPFGVTSTTTVYAHWTLNQYTVTFDATNGTAATNQVAAYGTTVTAPAAPLRSSYSFAGWYTAASGGTQVTFPYTVTGDVTVYAHWLSNTVTVTLDLQNGAASYVTTVVRNEDVTVGSLAYTGHTFAGWWTTPTGGTQFTFPYKVTDDVTLYAHWTLDSHTVTLEPGNGALATPIVAGYGTTIAAPQAPVRAHYDFDGWFTAASGGTEVAFPYPVEGDATLFAQWTISSQTVTLDPQNGDATTLVHANFDTIVTAPTDPSRPHYVFMGWFTDPADGQQIAFPFTANGDLTLYAHWLVDKHVVIFVPGNGASATNIPADYGTAIAAPPVPSRDNFTFLGWFTAETGGTQLGFPHTVTYDEWAWGHWSQDSFAVTFDALNGEAATTFTVPAGSSVPAPQLPTRVGYSFGGWIVSSSVGVASPTFPYTPEADTTLYAAWDRVPATFAAPDQVGAGDTIPVTGDSFLPGETVEIWLHSTPVKLATVVVGSDGTFATTVVIPSGTLAGTHHIEVRGSLSGTLSSPVTVTAVLASTGAEVEGPALLAALLMVGGFGIVIRRRRTA